KFFSWTCGRLRCRMVWVPFSMGAGHVMKSTQLGRRLQGRSLKGAMSIGELYKSMLRLHAALPMRVSPFGHSLPPIHYYIELTRRCNLRCRMCQFIDWLEQTPVRQQAEGELSTAE